MSGLTNINQPDVTKEMVSEQGKNAAYTKNLETVKTIMENLDQNKDQADQMKELLDNNLQKGLTTLADTEDGKIQLKKRDEDITTLLEKVTDKTVILADEDKTPLEDLQKIIQPLINKTISQETITYTNDFSTLTLPTAQENQPIPEWNIKEKYGKVNAGATFTKNSLNILENKKDNISNTDYVNIKGILENPTKANIQALQDFLYTKIDDADKDAFIKANKVGKVVTGNRDGFYGASTSSALEAYLNKSTKTSTTKEIDNPNLSTLEVASEEAVSKEAFSDTEYQNKITSDTNLLLGADKKSGITYDKDRNLFKYKDHSISRDKIGTEDGQITLAEFQKQVDTEHPVEGTRTNVSQTLIQETKIKDNTAGKEEYKTKTYDKDENLLSKQVHKHSENREKTITKEYESGKKIVTKEKEGNDRFKDVGDKKSIVLDAKVNEKKVMTADQVADVLEVTMKALLKSNMPTTNTLLLNYDIKIKGNNKVDISLKDDANAKALTKEDFNKQFNALLKSAGITTMDIKNYKMKGTKEKAVNEYTFKIDGGKGTPLTEFTSTEKTNDTPDLTVDEKAQEFMDTYDITIGNESELVDGIYTVYIGNNYSHGIYLDKGTKISLGDKGELRIENAKGNGITISAIDGDTDHVQIATINDHVEQSDLYPTTIIRSDVVAENSNLTAQKDIIIEKKISTDTNKGAPSEAIQEFPATLSSVQKYGTRTKSGETYIMTPNTSVSYGNLSPLMKDDLFKIENNGFDVKYISENGKIDEPVLSINITPKQSNTVVAENTNSTAK